MTSQPESSPRVLVIAGGGSHERDVSLRSGHRVLDAVRADGLEAQLVDLDHTLLAKLEQERPDVVWPVLHGASGEDGSLRGVLDLMGIPYVGSAPSACRRSFDKPVSLDLLGAAGIAVSRSVSLPQSVFRELGAGGLLAAAIADIGLPMVVKPRSGGSSLGVSVVADAEHLPRAMVDAFAYDSVAVLQEKVEGTEVAVSVIDTGDGPVALPPVEIVPDGGAYDYAARYTAGVTEFFCPSRLPEDVLARAQEAAVRAHEVLGLADLSRTDLIVRDGEPVVLEVNVAPGMTETSLLPIAVRAAGLELPDVYGRLVRQALARAGSAGAPSAS